GMRDTSRAALRKACCRYDGARPRINSSAIRSSASTGVTPRPYPRRRVTTEESANWPEDPGWRLNWRVMVRLVPQLQVAYMRRSRTDGLINLRSVWATFALGLLLIGDPLRFFLPFEDGWPSVFATIGLCAMSGAL